jgi:adenylate cyclase
MAIEIERKFLVQAPPISSWGKGVSIKQGYLARGRGATARVRVFGHQGFLTIKGKTVGISRQEFEYEIPLADAEALLAICEGGLISKQRWHITVDQHVWEIDMFSGDNEGLIVAEIELNDANESFSHPSWLGEEVSHDPKYFNGALSRHPFKQW